MVVSAGCRDLPRRRVTGLHQPAMLIGFGMLSVPILWVDGATVRKCDAAPTLLVVDCRITASG